jgi:heme-degrading monooxygenase HmoA
MPGFKAFMLCRRDGLKADDGFNYQSFSIWRDRLSFDNWRKSQQFKQVHGAGKPDVRSLQ